MCFITFLAIYQGKFGFGKFQQKLGLRSDPHPPLVGPKAQVFPKNYFDGTPQALINQTLTRLRRKDAATNRLDADVLRTEADHACLQVKTTILAILS